MNFWNELHTDWKHLIFGCFIFIGAFIVMRLVRWLMTTALARSSNTLKVDPTHYTFLKNAVSLIIWIIALLVIVYTIPKLKSLALTLFAGAGILVAILGFASQQAFANIVSGIFIVIFKPFRVGDLVRIGELQDGYIEDINLRHTTIRDFENKRIIIPNSVISTATIINSNIGDNRTCAFVNMSISYDSDVDLAMKIMRECCMNHPSIIDGRTPEEKASNQPMINIRLVGFGDSSVNLRAWAWAKAPLDARFMMYDLHKTIKAEFDKQGIEIPFPYRTIVYKKDQVRKNAEV